MKLRVGPRLVLVGALLPGVALVVAFVVSDRLLGAMLLSRLDQALKTQAAVETVSLFDGDQGQPHLHVGVSPLAESVRTFAPTGAIYGPDGDLVVQSAANEPVPARQLPCEALDVPVLRDAPAGRELLVSVRAPDHLIYTLRLLANLGPVEEALHAFRRIGLWVGGFLLGIVLVLQLSLAGSVGQRLRRLADALPRLREGDLGQHLPADGWGDEISELHQALAEASKRLRVAREAQERLLANAAHELRTPLGNMRTGIDLALRKERTAGELHAALEETRTEVDRLARLSSDLLEFAAIASVSWTRAPGDLSTVVAEAVDGFGPLALQLGVRLAVEAPASAEAQLDQQGVRRALDNLLSNALKYAPRGTTVTVRLAREDGRWVLTVSDEGPGVPQAERDRIFEPFQRADGSKEGSGLGLAIVREIARRHGGSVRLADTPKGASFALELPATA